MGSFRFGAPREMVLGIRDMLGIRTFIETGTNRGHTSAWASENFEKVITIEGFEPLYQAARKAYGDRKNIEFVLGDSREHIPRLTSTLTEPAIFWLDAHWCGEETFGLSDECPVMTELEAICRSSIPHVILIDDARLFLCPPPPPHVAEQWPDFPTICRELEKPPASRYVAVYEDVIAGIPSQAKAPFIAYVRESLARKNKTRPSPVASLKKVVKRVLKSMK